MRRGYLKYIISNVYIQSRSELYLYLLQIYGFGHGGSDDINIGILQNKIITRGVIDAIEHHNLNLNYPAYFNFRRPGAAQVRGLAPNQFKFKFWSRDNI